MRSVFQLSAFTGRNGGVGVGIVLKVAVVAEAEGDKILGNNEKIRTGAARAPMKRTYPNPDGC